MTYLARNHCTILSCCIIYNEKQEQQMQTLILASMSLNRSKSFKDALFF